MTTDFRVYEILAGTQDWRMGEEPKGLPFILLTFQGKEVKIPLPRGTVIDWSEA